MVGVIQYCAQIKLNRLSKESAAIGLGVLITGRIVLVSAGKVNTGIRGYLPAASLRIKNEPPAKRGARRIQVRVLSVTLRPGD